MKDGTEQVAYLHPFYDVCGDAELDSKLAQVLGIDTDDVWYANEVEVID